MSGCKTSTPPRSDQPSIAYRWNRVGAASLNLSDFVHKEYAPTISDNKKHAKSGPKSSEMLSTTKHKSVVGQIWNIIGALPIAQANSKLNTIDSGSQKGVILGGVSREQFGGASTLDDNSKYLYADKKTDGRIKPVLQPKFDFIKASQKISAYDICTENHASSLFCWFFNGGTKLPKSWKEKELASMGLSCELEKIYGWMKQIIPAGSQYAINIIKIENKTSSKIYISESKSSNAEEFISDDTPHHANNLTFRSVNCSDLFKSDASLFDTGKLPSNIGITSSLYSDYFLGALGDINLNDSVSSGLDSSLCSDYCIDSIIPSSTGLKKFQHNTNNEKMPKNISEPPQKLVVEDKADSASCERPCYALAKQEHAFAGAFAGIFVSLCLHPVDTTKTIIQSCRAEQNSVLHTGKSIISERGVFGLYRGIASNVASSAPISAIYTFTYETVKGSLLPLFPKEYHSFAHCIAGGCASVATSFVFTPSERVKQQMQIGSYYNNCWSALVGILRNGGLHSLYAGWGAVLCRNVPHSIIKFYTYENLKQLALSSQNSSGQPNTLLTLVCGGLAGSTAALFTTPFDVVKTRLQTQIPGSTSQYDNVFHALQVIGKNEGLKGLYRGLVPRLVMYMCQGALFFASYESFKRLFSLDVAQRIQYKEDDSTPLQLPS